MRHAWRALRSRVPRRAPNLVHSTQCPPQACCTALGTQGALQRFLCCISRRDWATKSLASMRALGAALSSYALICDRAYARVELNPVRGRLGLPLRPTYRRITTTSTFPAAGLVKKDTSLRAERGRAAKLRAATTRVRPQDSPESQSYAASHISATPAAAPRARSAGTLDSPSFRRAPQRDETPRAEGAPPDARRSARRQRARAATHRERHQ